MHTDRYLLAASLGRRLLPTSRRWRAAADHALSAFGLSSATGWALLHLGRMGDDTRQVDLANEIDINGASLVRTLDLLETRGLLVRIQGPSDRRTNLLRLTGAGRELVERIEEALAALRARLTETISEADLATTNRVLDAIDAILLDDIDKAR